MVCGSCLLCVPILLCGNYNLSDTIQQKIKSIVLFIYWESFDEERNSSQTDPYNAISHRGIPQAFR